ncbi:splicing factor ESS-2 homolog [Coccinella septempunctata]|uniref:splicing factor ESS-2 homolog n=1 Tax=Coccinella septempunctata TaxID=41139 RepID=UPI001D0664D4|nr:splicing factor ESS-2 homolog [Coccinella septempunctata]
MSNTNQSPGREALENMKTVHKDLLEFKKPQAPVRKKRKQIILDEDSYVEEIGKIIQRDFFPSLEKMKAQNDYLDAVEKNDISKLRELYTKYSGKKPPPIRVPSPATFETPANIHNTPQVPNLDEPSTPINKNSTNGPKLSLDQFLNSHDSEDNDSFVDILEESERKHREKYAYLYGVEGQNEEKQKKMLALPSIEQQAMLPEKEFNVDTWGYKNKNYIMYVPDGVALTEEKEKEINENRLQINYTNTRFVENPFNENQNKETLSEIAKTQAKTLDGKIGVDGKELNKETPKVAGYSFIKDPSPCPDAMASPLMTWGMIEGTPFRLDGSDTPLPRTSGPSFKMTEPARREQIALELAEKAAGKDKNRKKKAMDAAKRIASPSPRFSSSLDVLASMSPAARRLATSGLKIGLRTPDRTPQTGSATPGFRTKTPKTPKRIVTPKIKPPLSNSAEKKENLTDDLLKIQVPKRLTAADFF